MPTPDCWVSGEKPQNSLFSQSPRPLFSTQCSPVHPQVPPEPQEQNSQGLIMLLWNPWLILFRFDLTWGPFTSLCNCLYHNHPKKNKARFRQLSCFHTNTVLLSHIWSPQGGRIPILQRRKLRLRELDWRTCGSQFGLRSSDSSPPHHLTAFCLSPRLKWTQQRTWEA